MLREQRAGQKVSKDTGWKRTREEREQGATEPGLGPGRKLRSLLGGPGDSVSEAGRPSV